MHARGARYRQMQYIGRLMRAVDPAPIQETLDTLRNRHSRAAALLHRLENWRDLLIAVDHGTLDEITAQLVRRGRGYTKKWRGTNILSRNMMK